VKQQRLRTKTPATKRRQASITIASGCNLGEVHDGNAYFLGGSAGHAGLFSTARETLDLANQFFAGQTILLKPKHAHCFAQI